MVNWSARNILIASILISAIVGSLTGLSVGLVLKTSASTQTRDLYLFAVDGSFNFSTTRGLTSDYYYSTTNIIVNKGDTLVIHFYNPTDEKHSFTIASPYANNATVAAMTSTTISNTTITVNANTVGIFPFHCRFHQPQMTGTITVQGS